MSVLTDSAQVSLARRARVATGAAFMFNALVTGAWIPRIPEIKSGLHLSSGGLGVCLLAPAVGSLLAIPQVGAACARFGSAACTRGLALGFGLLAWFPGLAPNAVSLWFVMLFWGVTMGGLDVAMNAQGVTVERRYGRPVMSGFHGLWSVGALLGAGLGSLGAATAISLPAQQVLIVLGTGVPLLLLSRWYLPDPPPAVGARPTGGGLRARYAPRDARLLLLGGAAVSALLSEGAVGDWSAVLLRDDMRASSAQAGLGYAAFAAAMTTARLTGDAVVARLGRSRTLVLLAGVGAVGVSAGLASANLIGMVIGFGLLGLGLSSMVPIYFSAAAEGAQTSGPALAAVSGMGYVGFLIGPALIGAFAQRTSVLAALWLVPILLVVGVWMGVMGVRMAKGTT